MSSSASRLRKLGLDRALARQALPLALAAWLSFAVAASLHVANAYWAAMPVWVLAQSSRGLVIERALFRIVGTVVGAMVGFALVQLPLAPLAQFALLALWIALGMALTHVLRGMHGYGALLAGMTAAIVVIPSALSPAASVAIAVARVECTLIGVVVATLVLAAWTPGSALADFYARARAVSADSVGFAAAAMRGRGAPDDSGERRVVGLVSQLEASARLAAAGSVEGYRRLSDVDRLVVASLSTMAAAQAVRGARGSDEHRAARLERIAAHLRDRSAVPLPPAERALDTGDAPGLARLEAAVGQLLDANDALERPVDARPAASRLEASLRLAPHREWTLAWRTGAIAGLASFLAAALALAWNAPSTQLAALGVCIFVMVLGSLPLPQLVAPKLLAGVLVGVAVAIAYRLVVQPAIGSTTALLATIAPFLLVGAVARAHPRTAMPSLDANMCFLLASQAGMPATDDVGRILADSLALVAAAALLAGGFMLLPRRVERLAQHAADTIRRDLARILEPRDPDDPPDWQGRGTRQILRLTLHLGRAPALAQRWPSGLLATLNLGQALLELRDHGVPAAARGALVALLQRKMSPRDAAHALRELADAADDGGLAKRLRAVAGHLVEAEGLLTFGG